MPAFTAPLSTLQDRLNQAVLGGTLPPGLAVVIAALASSTQRISALAGKGGLADILGSAGEENIQGEIQKKLDVISNQIMIDGLAATGHLAGLASEEMAHHLPVAGAAAAGDRYLAVFDPLDGSTNIDINASIGTIFSVLPAAKGALSDASFLQPGHCQVAAGYALYGPATQLVLTWGQGVDVYTLNREFGEYVLSASAVSVPGETSEFAINSSNQRFWEPPISRYIEECLAGRSGVRGRDFNMRWTGSMVGDVHRVLSRGGVFLYPRDNKVPLKAGRLRLLYEANPMAMIMREAGGLATDAVGPILDIPPADLHQRVAVVLGSASEVARIARYHTDA